MKTKIYLGVLFTGVFNSFYCKLYDSNDTPKCEHCLAMAAFATCSLAADAHVTVGWGK